MAMQHSLVGPVWRGENRFPFQWVDPMGTETWVCSEQGETSQIPDLLNGLGHKFITQMEGRRRKK